MFIQTGCDPVSRSLFEGSAFPRDVSNFGGVMASGGHHHRNLDEIRGDVYGRC